MLDRHLDRLVRRTLVTHEELDSLVSTYGQRAVIRGLLARADKKQRSLRLRALAAHRQSRPFAGRAEWLRALPLRTACAAAMASH